MKKLLIYSVIITLHISFFTLNCDAQYTKLLDFAGTTNGSYPLGSLITDSTFLYGMTRAGGTNNWGTVFKIKPDGSGYLKLLDFAGATNGKWPFSSLIFDGTFLYGMTSQGGTNNYGIVFKIKPDGSTYIKLLDFAGTTNGSFPQGSLFYDGTFLYGMTITGGTNNRGTVFKIKPDGSSYIKLLDFTGTTNGGLPNGSLISDGIFLYGMTQMGGSNDNGTVFKIKPDGSGYLKLLDFADTTDGRDPMGSLIFDGTFLYGMTHSGGINDSGTVFKIKPDGSDYLKLLDFSGVINGSNPYGSFISDGTFLYGMTSYGGTNNWGTIFKIKPDGSNYLKLLDFAGVTNGSGPEGSLISDGTFLYGMTVSGGANNDGVVFKLSTAEGIEEINENNSIAVFPNPANDKITIETTAINKDAKIFVYNIQGQILTQQQIKQTKTELDISGLAKGVYILILNNNDKTEVTKFLKE